MPSAMGDPADLTGHRSVLNATEWIVIVFSRATGRVTGCHHYTALPDVLDAVELTAPGEYAEIHVPVPMIDGDDMNRYTAPPTGGAHLVDEGDLAGGLAEFTACGVPLLPDERWLPLTRGQAEQRGICPACQEAQPWQE